MHGFRWRNLEANTDLAEPKVTLGHVLKVINPNVKVIVMLRNPTDRYQNNAIILVIYLVLYMS